MSAIAATDDASENGRAPKDDLYRVHLKPVELRADTGEGEDGEGDGRTIYGHFAVTDRWTEINSAWEGRFKERFAPGAFKKTIRERGDKIRLLFQHGMDPQVGDKPIAVITDLREDEEGVYYEGRLLDGVPELVVSGLRAGLYGASFKFASVREAWVEEPEPSDENPDGLPERTVKEARIYEGGPVTFGAYDEATSALRSATDHFLIMRSADPESRALLLDRMKNVPAVGTRSEERAADEEDTDTPTDNGAAPDTTETATDGVSDRSRREDKPRTTRGPLKPEDWSWGTRKANHPWSI